MLAQSSRCLAWQARFKPGFSDSSCRKLPSRGRLKEKKSRYLPRSSHTDAATAFLDFADSFACGGGTQSTDRGRASDSSGKNSVLVR